MITDTRRHCPACDREYDTVEHPRPGCPKCLPPSPPFFAAAVKGQMSDLRRFSIEEVARAFEVPAHLVKKPDSILEKINLAESRRRSK